jgi:uncharacterized protein (TIGR00251 family)
MSRYPELSSTDGGTVLAVHVQPGAGRTEVVGRYGEALKVRVAAPPTGNRANEAVIELVAAEFGVAPSAISVLSGATNRQKRLRLEGVELRNAERVIDRLLTPPDKR